MKSPIKTGICSFGMSGKLFHAPFIQAHPAFELTGIVERHQQDSRELYPASRIYRSVEELCADQEIELVVVNTPTHLHYEHGRMVLESGKHLVIEKPFCVSVEQARQLTGIAATQNLFLSVYQNRRYDGDYRAVKNIIQKQLLGELREAEIRYDRYRPVFGGKAHKEGDLEGAGVLYDLSPHLVDQAIQLFGFPTALFADIWKMRDDVAAPDYFEILLFYDKLRVRLNATCIARESTYAYKIHGMKGSFLQHRSDLQEQQLQAGQKPTLSNWCAGPPAPDGLLHTETDGKLSREQTTSSPGNYMGYYEDVFLAISGKGPNPVPADDGIRNMLIIEAALESVKSGKIVELELKS